MMGLTRRQADCLAAIKAHIAERGSSPSYHEIAATLGVRSLSTVTRLLCALKQRGHINFIPTAARSITLRRPDAAQPLARESAGAARRAVRADRRRSGQRDRRCGRSLSRPVRRGR